MSRSPYRRPRYLPSSLLIASSALALALSACQQPVPDEQEATSAQAQRAAEAASAPAPATAATAPPVGRCDATQAQSLVGHLLTDALRSQVQHDTAAQRLRVIAPGQSVSPQFDGERLNIDVDGQQRVTGVRCG